MTSAKAKLPVGVDKLPEGIELNGSSVRIHFMYRGERCREKIQSAKVSKALIRYAGNKRLLIVTEIAEGRFDYAAHFPESKRALALAGVSGANAARTVKQGIDRWLDV
ncbi:Arm DNA-binding domain-containing protein [Pseudomonas sp. YH-1]|uniref:Arm DNA-binding domain-containing protein n=1 Tax=Pseudomonas sp. YH-1 TaxID=3384787 RepID=UPI003F7ED6DD